MIGRLSELEYTINSVALKIDVLLAERNELLAALKAMVASYDGIRDALTCKTVIAKLAQADAAIKNAENDR